MANKAHGVEELQEGHTFHWSIVGNRSPEIMGHIQDSKGKIVPGTSGWYRTSDAAEATKYAESKLKEIAYDNRSK